MALDDSGAASEHPGIERLAEYADDVLAPEDRAELERHLAACEDCRAVLADTMAFMISEGTLRAPSPHAAEVVTSARWTRLATAAAALATAAIVVFAVRSARVPSASDAGEATRGALKELVAALANEPSRPVEGRLTGGFAYAAAPSTERGASRAQAPAERLARARIEAAQRAQPGPATDAALAVSLLVGGETSAAIAELERLTSASSNAAEAWSDLSAAYLARAADGDAGRAIAAADRALAISPSLAEARFNRALALTAAGDREAARRAWGDYARSDPASGWGREAARRSQEP